MDWSFVIYFCVTGAAVFADAKLKARRRRRLAASRPRVRNYGLRPDPDVVWINADGVTRFAKILLDESFRPIGNFRWRNGAIAAYLNSSSDTCGVVYDEKPIGIGLAVHSEFEDGTNFTCVAGMRPSTEQLPWHPTLYIEGDAASIYQDFLRARPPKPPKRLDVASFVRLFERWEIRAKIFENSRLAAYPTLARRTDGGRTVPPTEAELALRQRKVEEQGIRWTSEWILELFAYDRDLPFTRRRDLYRKTLVVHDLLPLEQVAERALGRRAWVNRRVQSLLASPTQLTPRALMETLNEERRPDRRFRKIAEVGPPVPADIYERP